MSEVDYNWLIEHIICHYSYWDGPVSAYVMVDGKIMFAKFKEDLFYLIWEGDDDDCEWENIRTYNLIELDWNEKCAEWLEDYKKSYFHCFYENKTQTCFYDGRDLSWFGKKWEQWHPALESSVFCAKMTQK